MKMKYDCFIKRVTIKNQVSNCNTYNVRIVRPNGISRECTSLLLEEFGKKKCLKDGSINIHAYKYNIMERIEKVLHENISMFYFYSGIDIEYK